MPRFRPDLLSSEAQFWQLVRTHWLLILILGGVFVLGQVLETLLLPSAPLRLLFDVVGWGALCALALWLSLAFVRRQTQHYRTDLEHALQEQQHLNQQLQRANSHLALLSDVNQHLAETLTLDDVLDATLVFPQRLVPGQAAALLLLDATGAVETRTTQASSDELAALRAACGVATHMGQAVRPDAAQAVAVLPRRAPEPLPAGPAACVLLPLHDGRAAVGWIEIYTAQAVHLAADERTLLQTIASEIAEAIVSARRRAQAALAVYELERAVADERARIARDIHDGLAQNLAFVRMRVDLWQDWIADEPERLHIELAGLKQTLRAQIHELRRAIFALRPLQFEELGFVGGLRRYIEEFAGQHGWETHIDLTGVPAALPLAVETICFRLVQEALTNAAKHAAATRVDVVLTELDQGVQVTVRDNGHGFAADALPTAHAGRVGLRQMRERLAAVRGQLVIRSVPAAGTEVQGWIPLAAAQAADTPLP